MEIVKIILYIFFDLIIKNSDKDRDFEGFRSPTNKVL